jgi:hypothetical protein
MPEDTKTNDKANDRKSSYVCVEPIHHNGKRYEPGSKISLGDDHAAPLLEIKHIAPAAAEKAKA